MLRDDTRDDEPHEKDRGCEADRCIGPDYFRKCRSYFVHDPNSLNSSGLLSEIGLRMEAPRRGSFPIPRGAIPTAMPELCARNWRHEPTMLRARICCSVLMVWIPITTRGGEFADA
jgi:hypothetical protein